MTHDDWCFAILAVLICLQELASVWMSGTIQYWRERCDKAEKRATELEEDETLRLLMERVGVAENRVKMAIQKKRRGDLPSA